MTLDAAAINRAIAAASAAGVDNLTIDGVDRHRPGRNNVSAANFSVNSPYDAICLKSSFTLAFPRATESVTISDCDVQRPTNWAPCWMALGRRWTRRTGKAGTAASS